MWRLLVFIKRSFAISPHVFARGIRLFHALSNQRAQGKPDARCTRGLVCKLCKKHAHEHTGPAEAIRLSLRSGFNAYFRALPGDQALGCHRRLRFFSQT